MGTSVVRELTAEERARMPEARQEMERAGAAACATKFTFLAAFDGTNNDENNLKLSGTKLSTNVSQLRTQARVANSDSLKSGYYPGVGTGGDQGGLVNAAVLPTPAIQAAAENAYGEFRLAALDHLRQNPDATTADIGAATTGFSRGGAAAIRFAQLVHERGLTDSDGQVIAPPGSVPISGMALIDPVARFVDAPMHIPPNVRGPVLSVIADHETRTDFRPLYHVDDPRVSLVHHPGNHVGNGGGHDPHGTAASVLEGVTGYFQQRGIAIADVPPGRRHDPNAPQLLYTEVWQTARNGDVLENEDGSKNAVWRHDPPAAGRIGVKPQVPPSHEAWLEKARQELGPRLQAAGFSPEMCERIITGCVCQAAGHHPAGTEAPRFLLGKDQQRLGVLHPPGVLQEMLLDEVLQDHSPTAPAVPSPERTATPLHQPADAQTMTR
ncbi:hypothetical protein ACFQNJ_12550 [Hydrogenophaga bisanensis]|uniref:Alpha/beta hydrolase family protein DUF2235 n=1 Tax=Hydrogenophaga bisanensis TaxID=439611 RepID=A0ABW2RB48_9BURK